MKIKIFAGEDALAVEEAVNEFIKDKFVIDIKYESMLCMFSKTRGAINDRVMVMYEESEDMTYEQNV